MEHSTRWLSDWSAAIFSYEGGIHANISDLLCVPSWKVLVTTHFVIIKILMSDVSVDDTATQRWCPRVIFLGQIKLILHCPLPVLRVGFFKLQVFYDIREIFCLPIFKSSRAFYLQWWLVIPTKYQVLEIFGGKWSIKVSFLWFKKGLIFSCI